jgi:hypothetical protein
VLADQRQRAVDVLGRFRVEGDHVGTGLGEIGNDAVHRLHHQVHVDHRFGVRAQRLAHQRADGQVGHVMVVHHVEMDPVGARGDDVAHFLAECGEVGGQNAGGDQVIQIGGAHGTAPKVEAAIVSGRTRAFLPQRLPRHQTSVK